jgi:sulfur carrier protein
MNILLNGKQLSADNNISLIKLLELNNINEKNIVIEINKKIITKDLWGETRLNKNDKIEVITAVGGG